MSGADIRSLLISIIMLVLSAIVGIMVTRYWNRKKDEKAMEARIVELEKQVAALGQTVVPISTAFQAILVKQLTHDHTPETDLLLKKIGPPNILTDAEMVDLVIRLKSITHDLTIDVSERDAARMLPLVMERVRAEAEQPPVEQVPTLINIPRDATEAEKDTEKGTS